ncbi:MAG: signal peptidase I [Nitrospirae bacterium]|nr:signal peptidase I [Nitrospirota bacterium]
MKQSKLWEYIKAIGIALMLALIIRSFVVQAFKIPSGSMLQTLLIGDHILVNKFIYGTPIDIPFTNITIFRMPGFKKPQREDIIVFKYPEDPGRDFIKRVIAVEGDMIESKDKRVLVNGKPVSEPYAQHTDNSTRMGGMEPRDNFGPYLVPKNKVFVMGDNRDQSYDSRYWGYVDMKELRGKAFIIYWSWDGIKKMPRLGRIGKLVR